MLTASLRSYLAEPAIPDPPRRVWRDWAVVGAASVGAVLEVLLRTDAEWVQTPVGWRLASLVMFFVTLPPAILVRRTQPLLATVWAFAPTMVFGAAMALFTDAFGSLMSVGVLLVVPYALYRWGSGRQGLIGGVVILAAWIVGTAVDPGSSAGDWIGGFIVLSIPVQAGMIVRYRAAARERAIDEVKSREREELARELHDTVAHHVSAIAVQAQAGRAVATADPERALEVLAVIEEAASRTLEEMRAMVGTLRNGTEADLAPQQGVADLARLAGERPGGLRVDVDVDTGLGRLGPAVDAAIYRIAQESVTNAVKHARRASKVRVELRDDGDVVRLSVTDDGDVVAIGPAGGGYGLLGMTERAELVGGRLTAGPSAGAGWCVVAELPRAKAVS